MKTAIYKAQIDTPFGTFLIAVDSTKDYARSDIYNAAYSEFPAPNGMLRIKHNITKSNKRILSKMYPIKNARKNDTFWAWVKKLT